MSDFRDLIERESGRAWSNKHLDLPGGLRLSVQASAHHYCSPRVHQANPRAYDEWELALFRDSGPWLMAVGFEDLWNGDQVAAYVPTDRVQALYDALMAGGAVVPVAGEVDPAAVLAELERAEAPEGEPC